MFANHVPLSAGRVYLLMRAWSGFAWALIMTAYALYYITVAHLDPLQLVLVGTALEASYLVCEIPTGVFADTYSRRFSVIAGFVIVGVAWTGQGLVPTFVAVVGFEILRGLGEALSSGATEAWIAGEVGDDAIGPLFLRGTQLSQTAWFIGLPVGVGLGLIDIRIPIVLGGLLQLALAIALALVMPERRHPRRDAVRTWRATFSTANRAMRSVRTNALLLALLGAELFWGAASEGYDRLWEVHLLRDLAFPPFGIPPVVAFGVLSLAVSAVVIGTARLAQRAIARFNEQAVSRALIAMQVIHIGSRSLFALAPTLGVALAAYFISKTITTMFQPIFNAWLIRRTDEEVRATVLSTTSVANALGQVCGGPVSGAIGNALGLPAALLSSAILLVPGAAFFARASARRTAADSADRRGR